MKDDLADALIPVFWAGDHIPVLQERLLNWQRRYNALLRADWGQAWTPIERQTPRRIAIKLSAGVR